MLSASRKIYRGFATYTDNPFKRFISSLQTFDGFFKYYGLAEMNDPKIDLLPYSIRILLENVMRNCDQFEVKTIDVLKVLNWQEAYKENVQIPFKPSRVLLQDFTGVSSIVDLVAMRDAMKQIGGDPLKINPQCPVHLVIDHSIQTDATKTKDAWLINQKIEFQKNKERFEFLKWGSRAFSNLEVIPPGGGILHQVNLQFLAKILATRNGNIFPDTVVGTDVHTSMANGMGVLGWGVGGLEAQVAMLGQPIPIKLPQVVGIHLQNRLKEGVTATDFALTLTQQLKKVNVSGKFVQFFGPGVATLTIPERATVSNMAHQFGATVAFFPADSETLRYLEFINRDFKELHKIEVGLKLLKLLRDNQVEQTIKYSSTINFDLNKIGLSITGPKRPFDQVSLYNAKQDWNKSLTQQKSKGYSIAEQKLNSSRLYKTKTGQYEIKNGSIVIASINSCMNTVNPKVMIGAGLLAKKAREKGLKVKPYVKTSLSSGSPIVIEYLEKSHLLQHLNALGFNNTGFGCMTCIGNSGEIDKQLNDIIKNEDFIVCSVTSGNTNYESRLHRRVKANYLMSPALVIVYALVGNIDIDLDNEPIGYTQYNTPIFLKDIWPTDKEIEEIIKNTIKPQMYQTIADALYSGTRAWNRILVNPSTFYNWNKESTYIQKPPYLQNIDRKPKGIDSIKNAFVLAYFGDDITTDHISPSGRIPKDSLAGKYLFSKGLQRKDFNTYGSRRGNYKVLIKGTFSHPLIINKLSPVIGPKTTFVPTGEVLNFTEAGEKYKQIGHATIVLAGNNYGTGSTRDWAARGPYLLGVRAVIAQGYDPKHRYNLVEMGILPLEFTKKQTAQSLGLTGKQTFTINIPYKNLVYGQIITVSTNIGTEFQVRVRLDTQLEVQYYRHGGILPFYLRKLRNKK